MMLRGVRLCAVAAATALWMLVLAHAAPASVRPGDDESTILPHMQALYEDAVQDMLALGLDESVTEVRVIDAAILYQYSNTQGLRPISLLIPDERGLVHFPDGLAMARPAEGGETPDIAMSMPPGGYKPIRAVSSIMGYRMVEGVVTLPASVSGVDGAEGKAEGAFNYLGLKKEGVFDVEVGMCTQYNETVHDGGRWYMYHSLNGAVWERDDGGWPPGGAAPGSSIHITMYVPGGGNSIGCSLQGSGYALIEKTYNIQGPRFDGAGQRFRRMTTMVLGGAGGVASTHWRGIKLYAPSSGGTFWHETETDPDPTRTYKTRGVNVNTVYHDYDEYISINFTP